MLGLLMQAAICVMLPEQNAGKASQKILNLLRVQFGQAGDGMFSEILALIQAQLKSHLTYGAADFENAHTFPEEVRETSTCRISAPCHYLRCSSALRLSFA